MAARSDLQALLDALDEPSLLVDGGKVITANSAASALFRRPLPGIDVRLVLRHPHVLDQLLARRPADVEAAGIGEAERPWIISLRPGPDGCMLVRLKDNSAARASEKMRVDFVANASHELRTPLATILGYAETIADDRGLEPDDCAKFGGVIRTEAVRMLRIIEDLMSLSRIEADRFVAPREVVPVEQLVRGAVESARPLAGSRRCTVSADVPAALPSIVGDRAQLSQMLDNLVANALRYGCTRAGCTVRVSAEMDGDAVVLTVADTGDGIPREHLPRLTERFYRVDAARSRDAGGTGLGLAIVKHIVERHRGSLDIRSTEGVGTQVEISLPVR